MQLRLPILVQVLILCFLFLFCTLKVLSGFDTLYILETLLSLGHRPKIVSKGNKILKLEYNRVVCLDSFMFFHSRYSNKHKYIHFSFYTSIFVDWLNYPNCLVFININHFFHTTFIVKMTTTAPGQKKSIFPIPKRMGLNSKIGTPPKGSSFRYSIT